MNSYVQICTVLPASLWINAVCTHAPSGPSPFGHALVRSCNGTHCAACNTRTRTRACMNQYGHLRNHCKKRLCQTLPAESHAAGVQGTRYPHRLGDDERARVQAALMNT